MPSLVSPSFDPVRIAIVGCGGMGYRHATALTRIPGVDMVACADTDPGRRSRLAKQFGIPMVFPTAEELFLGCRADAVSICTSNSSHARLSIGAMEAGFHVMCEKPMALHAPEAATMEQAARRTGRLLTVGHYMRYLPQTQALRRRIQDGELGKVHVVRCRGLRRQGVPAWGHFHRKAIAGGGPLLDTAVHTLDLVLHLLDWPHVQTASGVALHHRVGHPAYQNHPDYGPLPPEPMDVEDLALGLLRLESGATMTLEVSWAGLTPEDEDYAQVLVGDRSGALIRPFGPGPLLETFHSVQGRSVDVAYGIPECEDVYLPQMNHWVQVLRGEEAPLVKPSQAVTVLSVIDALYESAALGREVSMHHTCSPNRSVSAVVRAE